MRARGLERDSEIKVAFIGWKNAGKSTLINALLKDTYTPVRIGGATASVNSFRVFSNATPNINADDNTDVADDATSLWTVFPENLRTAQETRWIISDHNNMHPTTNGIQEMTFDVELPEGLCDMQSDTSLVLIDIPGISNEAECRYFSYFRRTANTFNCVVFVMDVLQCIDKQALLLRRVKACFVAQGIDIPVIGVCNKVDDASNQEVASRVSKFQEQYQEEFNENCK
jgi:GTP-binding protein EngB required for normal cell division